MLLWDTSEPLFFRYRVYFSMAIMSKTCYPQNQIRILGLMTGSSADGLDLCLVEFTGHDPNPAYRVCYSRGIKYPKKFSTAFASPLQLDDGSVAKLDHSLGIWLADVIAKLNLSFDVIASHGQTIKHQPPNFTLQIGDPSFMATRFGVPVVYDFRSADLKEGGQGAPLIPIVDEFLFRQEESDILCLNIGGIANLTVIPSLASGQSITAWDTGPGNTLMDKAVRHYTGNRLAYDPDGSFGAKGKLNLNLLEFLLEHEFYALTPPRSAGQEQFGNDYFKQILNKYYPAADQEFYDLIFTLTVLTAKAISRSVKDICNIHTPSMIHASGGGVHNKTLMDLLAEELDELRIKPVDVSGVTADNKEAFGFAYIAYRSLNNMPGNLSSVTGARREVVLGKIFNY